MSRKEPFLNKDHDKVHGLVANVPGVHHRCRGIKANGEQCKNKPHTLGGDYCKFHGGASPSAIRSAQEWIDIVAPQLVGILFGIAEDANNEPRDRVLAARELLSRTAVVRQPNQAPTVTVNYNPNTDPVRLEILRQAREAAASIPAKSGKVFDMEQPIDVDVVDDDAGTPDEL